MSETTYYIDRDYYGDVALWRENEPDDLYPLALTTSPEVIDMARSLGVEDRTKPDWSHVPVGTAGTATVRGFGWSAVEGPERRAFKSPRSGFRVIGDDGHIWHVEGEYVTDFTPDVVVTDELIERVITSIYTSGDRHDIANVVEAILRGKS